MKKFLTIFVVFAIAAVLIVVYLKFVIKSVSVPTPAQTQIITTIPEITKQQIASTTSLTTADSHPGMKLYRNEQWGFEFWYPERWEVVENSWRSPFSKFNLAVHMAGIYPNFEPFEINVTTEDFVNRSFIPLKDKAKQIIIDGVVGTRYEYIEETYYINIIVSINDARIIMSNSNKEHLSEFNQIISTFKFLK